MEEKTEELERKLRFLTLINRSFKKLSDYDEEKEARKIRRKSMKDVKDFCYCLSQWVYWTNLLEIEFIFSTHQ